MKDKKLIEMALYKTLKEYYEILEIDEDVDEIELKKAYRQRMKKYHPDVNPDDEYAEEMCRKVLEAYENLSDERNRRLYSVLRERYGELQEEQYEQQRTYESLKTKETANKYFFQRRDGSKIEIQPLNQYTINGKLIYKYKIIQYYNNMTFINDVYGRMNLSELLNTPEYCDFCVNNFLSRRNIENSRKIYNGYIGYVEYINRNGVNMYRICDREKPEECDIVMDIYKLEDKNDNVDVDSGEYNIWLEKMGKIITNGKISEQYILVSEDENFISIIYSENIDFNEIRNNSIYKYAIANKLLQRDRLKSKIDIGGYVGQLLYNPESEHYDIIVDREIEKLINIKQRNMER